MSLSASSPSPPELSWSVFSLSNFEGSLELLLKLVHENELDVGDLQLTLLMEQFTTKSKAHTTSSSLEQGAEFISMASLLFYLKSQRLLPSDTQEKVDEEPLSFLQLLPQVADYCRFKNLAVLLAKQEEQQSPHFFRGSLPLPAEEKTINPLVPALREVSLDDLAQAVKQVLAQAAKQPKVIREETWRVADKIRFITSQLTKSKRLAFESLFSPDRPKEELIVTFLALLELLKNHKAQVREEHGNFWILPPSPSNFG